MKQLEETSKKNQTSWAKLKDTFSTMRDVMQGPVGVMQIAIGVFNKANQVIQKMESDWGAAAEASALLGNVIKTTGANAWTTQAHLEGIAQALQRTTKYGDETIESMQTVLLGFRNITGKEFDQATTSVLDMATVMKMDLTSAAQAVGKALDNPAQGLDSLSRQGFKFTDQEKAMMKAMQEAGNISGAQKIILDELAKTYGGASEAAGALSVNLKERLGNAVNDVSEEMGRATSRNLAPFREYWLKIALAVGAAAKAQNDFRDAIYAVSKGTATQSEQLTALYGELDYAERMRSGTLSGTYQYNLRTQEIEQLKTQIGFALQQLGYQKLSEEAARKAAAAQAARDEEIRKAQERITAFAKERSAILDTYNSEMEVVSKAANDGAMSQEDAAAREVSLNNDRVMALEGLSVKYNDLWGKGNQDLLSSFIVKTETVDKGLNNLNIIGKEIKVANILGIGDKGELTEWDEYIKKIKEAADSQDLMVSTIKTLQDAYGEAFEAMGEALASGEDGWAAFAEAGCDAIAAVLKGLGEQLIIKGLAALPDLALAATYAAGAAAAYAAAGWVGAQSFAEGGIVAPTSGGTKAIVAEAGEAEVISPLSKLKTMINDSVKNGGSTIVNKNVTVHQYIGGSVIAQKELDSRAVSAVTKASRGY